MSIILIFIASLSFFDNTPNGINREETSVIDVIRAIGKDQLSKKTDRITEHIMFPVFVECLSDKQKGKHYEKEEFISNVELILDEKAMRIFAGASDESIEKLVDEDGSSIYRISVDYIKKGEIDDEYTRGFLFRQMNNTFILYSVNCAG